MPDQGTGKKKGFTWRLHTYNFETFERVIADIRASYLAAFDELHEFLLVRRIDMP